MEFYCVSKTIDIRTKQYRRYSKVSRIKYENPIELIAYSIVGR